VLLAVSCKKIAHFCEAIVYHASSGGYLSDDTLIAVEFNAKNIGKIALTVFAFLAVFDVVGLLLCWFLDIVHEISMGEFYALWFVLAVFCGILTYTTAIDMASPKTPENARKAGLLAVLATVVIIAAASFGSYMIWWRDGIEATGFVPDNEPLSITFFVTVLASSILVHTASGPKSKRRKR
jgi:hypothetical protein